MQTEDKEHSEDVNTFYKKHLDEQRSIIIGEIAAKPFSEQNGRNILEAMEKLIDLSISRRLEKDIIPYSTSLRYFYVRLQESLQKRKK